MAKVLGLLVVLIVLFFGIKLALAAMSFMAVAGSIAVMGCFAVGSVYGHALRPQSSQIIVGLNALRRALSLSGRAL